MVGYDTIDNLTDEIKEIGYACKFINVQMAIANELKCIELLNLDMTELDVEKIKEIQKTIMKNTYNP